MSRVRCAIYTRKSSEEGLEQDFNSLDAQFEACAAYVKSQAGEGWTLSKDRYDDGGMSGGTLARPGLQRLLADIAAGRIDIVVVYKVDRLTRSLLDFSKLVEAFDNSGTSFVSVTQSFNTTNSMGRLTLNMLLSFAQFEREVTAERIRDKIAASKAKGMWMGGTPPLGYRPDGRSLAIVEDHAAIVRTVFDRYLVLGNVRLLEAELIDQGVIKPLRSSANGRVFGGGAFNRADLYKLLGNPIYAGNIRHGNNIHPGLHPAIIDPKTWDEVQVLLAEHVKGERGPRGAKEASALAGLVHDNDGEPLLAVHACKGQRRYRYYVSRRLHEGRTGKGWRVPASQLEPLVITSLADLLENPLQLVTIDASSLDFRTLEQSGKHLSKVLGGRTCSNHKQLCRAIVERVIIEADRIAIHLNPSGLAERLGVAQYLIDPSRLAFELPVRLTRTGRAMRLVEGNRIAAGPAVDLSLIRLVAKGRAWWRQLIEDDGLTTTRIASREGCSASYVTRVVRLAFLSPEVIEALLAGRQSAFIDGTSIVAPNAVSADWQEQRRALLA